MPSPVETPKDAPKESPKQPPLTTQIACYVRGTRIRTATGDHPIETLAPGDVLPTAMGRGDATIRWMGRRLIRCDRHHAPGLVHPIRIAAGAFGDALPHRDLFLSPEHAVFLGGALIPVRHLVNGATIAPHPVKTVEYWHIELDRHDIILADGMPAESWLDTGTRSMFANAERVDLRFSEPRPTRGVWAKLACAPLLTGGPALQAIRQRLDSFYILAIDEIGEHKFELPASCQGVNLITPRTTLEAAWLDGMALDAGSMRAGITRAFIAIPPARRPRQLRLMLTRRPYATYPEPERAAHARPNPTL